MAFIQFTNSEYADYKPEIIKKQLLFYFTVLKRMCWTIKSTRRNPVHLNVLSFFVLFRKQFVIKCTHGNRLRSVNLTFYFYSQTYNALFCETSAKDGSNIVEAVLHLAR